MRVAEALGVGTMWLLLTLMFEIAMFRKPDSAARTCGIKSQEGRVFSQVLTPVTRNSGWHAIQVEPSLAALLRYFEQALAGSGLKLIA